MRSHFTSRFISAVLLLLAPLTPFCIASTPEPVSLNFGTDFFGSDGLWSAAQIRVGSPEQYIWAFPNTISSETWVVGPGGCDLSLECQEARGGLFYANRSTTYDRVGRYELTSNRLGVTPNYGDYALDNISISDTVSASAQVIATVNTTDIWIAQFGLNVQDIRFDGLSDQLPFISTLVEVDSIIPSHSYGYTAGAHYALKSVPGSLVLGGVDTTRYNPTDISFTLAPGYYPDVAVQSVTVTSTQSEGLVDMPPNWNTNPLRLMQPSQAAMFTIDTSTPFLWMPLDVCDTFANALNLTYDDTMQVYLFQNGSTSQDLSNWGLSFTFTLANSLDSTTETIQIPITYRAFDTQLTYPFPGLNASYGDPAVDYFPLRRANLSTQYTIGRAFLQETYLVVDYERNEFSVSPAIFPDIATVVPNIVAITRPTDSDWPGPVISNKASLSAGAKAGIGVGVTVVVLAIIALVLFFIKQRRKPVAAVEYVSKKRKRSLRRMLIKRAKRDADISELSGDRSHPREMLVDSSNTRFELDDHTVIEMPAEDVPETYLAVKRAASGISGVDNELADAPAINRTNHGSIRKDYNIRAAETDRSSSPAPPYSPSDTVPNHSSSDGISPYDSRGSGGFNSHSSAGATVSPAPVHLRGSLPDDREGPASRATPAARANSDTNRSSRSTTPILPSQRRVTRTASHSSRFGEEALVLEGQELSAQARARFSWED